MNPLLRPDLLPESVPRRTLALGCSATLSLGGLVRSLELQSDAMVGKPTSMPMAAMALTPARNLLIRSISDKSNTRGSKHTPSEYTTLTTTPKENGLMFSLSSRAAAVGDTLSPATHMSTREVISI